MELFSFEHNKLNLAGADVRYYPNFLDLQEASRLYSILYETTPWQQDDIKVFGKVYAQPRLTALYGDNDLPYSYSNITMHPKPFTKELLKLKQSVQEEAQTKFTTCLLNLYRTGNDSNGWHADNEKELGANPVIASISLGAKRKFRFRENKNKSNTFSMDLEHGSLLLMQGATQHNWQHQIPKTAKDISARINLTFRKIVSS